MNPHVSSLTKWDGLNLIEFNRFNDKLYILYLYNSTTIFIGFWVGKIQ